MAGTPPTGTEATAGTPPTPAPFNSDDIPVGAGWRTAWTDQCSLGAGFHREISTPAPSAISYKPVGKSEGETVVANRVQGFFKMIENSSEFSELFTVGGGLSMEGWGVAGSTTVQATDQMTLKSNALTAVVSMRYLSEPIIEVNPSDKNQEVTLTAAAIELLETAGPKQFHGLYGTHYIAGYLKGGYLIGSFATEFETKEQARNAEANVKLNIDKAVVVKAEARFDYKTEVGRNQGYKGVSGQYICRGWSKDHPPKLACSMEDLVAAHNEFNPREGTKIAAILRSYRDIPQYAVSRANYNKKPAPTSSPEPASSQPSVTTDKPETPVDNYDEVFVQPENYGVIVHILNQEYGRLCYLYQYLRDAEKPDSGYDKGTGLALANLRDTVRATMRRFKKLLTMQTSAAQDIVKIRETLKGLEAYLVLCEGEKPASGSALYDLWKAGYSTLYDTTNGLFKSEDLEKNIHETVWRSKSEVPAGIPTTVPVNLSPGWTAMTTKDNGSLQFAYNGEKVLVLQPDGNIWSKLFNGFISERVLPSGWTTTAIGNDLQFNSSGKKVLAVQGNGDIWSSYYTGNLSDRTLRGPWTTALEVDPVDRNRPEYLQFCCNGLPQATLLTDGNIWTRYFGHFSSQMRHS